MTLRAAILPTALLLALGGAAQAQLINPFASVYKGLTPKDVDMVAALTATVNKSPKTPVQSWTNAESGNSGTVRFVKNVKRRGAACHQIAYVFKGPTTTQPQSNYTMLWCKAPDGSWKIGD